MNVEKLYARLPIFAQNWICSGVGWRIQTTRYGRKFHAQLREARERDRWPADQLQEYRDRRIADFVQHAATTVPHYQQGFRDAGIDPRDIRGLHDLAVLPVLSKRDIQRDPSAFCSRAVPRRRRLIVHTSGTTGSGLRFPTTLTALQEQWAMYWRFRLRLGIQLDTWCAYFGGRSVVPLAQQAPPFWRINGPGHQILFSGYHLAPHTYDVYLEELSRRRAPWLHGYPSVLSLLAGHLLATGRRLAYQPLFITTGSENLHPHQLTMIEQGFGVRPYDSYNLTEAVASMSQCPRGRLHVDEDFAGVEFLPAGDGSWRVVGTNLSNPALPLLRYDVGDRVELGNEPCDCGLAGRTVRSIDGRSEDYVVLRNGARLGRMDHIFKDMTAVREAQIYQREPGAIVVRVVRNPDYNLNHERMLREEFMQRVGDQADVAFQYVESLSRSRQGKLRFVVSELDTLRS